MKKKNLFFLIVALIILSSCNVVRTSTSKTMDVYGSGIIQVPVVVDLDVKATRVSGTAVGVSMEIAKLDALADAVKKANADVLVEPKFETETTNGNTTVSVSGYPATYKNFRSLTAADTSFVKVLHTGIVQKANTYEPPKVQPKKSSAGIIVGTVLGIVLIVAIAAAL